MVSRLVFEIRRRDAFPEPAFLAAVVMPAQHQGLRGEFKVQNGNRYTAVMEGSKDATEMFVAFLDTLEVAIGEVTGLKVTHHHAEHAFAARGVKMVFPE